MAKDRVSSSMNGNKEDKSKKKKSKKSKKFRVKEMHIRRAANGGYLIRHDLNEPAEDGTNSEEHGVSDMQQLHDHIDEHMGAEASQGGQQEAQPQPQDAIA